jgi:hypothetical protein
MIRKPAVLLATLLAVLMLAGCGSTNPIFGGGNDNTNPSNGTYNNDLRGTVDSVDTRSGSILLTNTSGYGSMLSSAGSGSTVRVYYDNNTQVLWNGQSYSPSQLDRGDQVDVQVRQSGNRLVADTMTVTYNSTASNNYPNNNYPNNGSYSSDVVGTVRYVDTSRRTVQVDTGYGNLVTVSYDPNTPVLYNGSTYNPSNLEQGDQVTIRTSGSGSNGMLYARDITVTRSMSANGGSSSSQYATIRGTVQSVNTSRHTIEISQPNWISGFNPGAGSSMSTMTVQYDPAAQISVGGQLYPISGLERGDVIDVQVSNPNSSLPFAQQITLVRNVRG